MKRREKPPPTVYVGDHTDKLSRIRPHAHDPDERQTREDRAPQESQLFRIPVARPRWLRPRKKS